MSDDAEDVFDDTTLCEVCRRGDREHLLLLCDSCDLGYHTTCLNTPLLSVPRGRWFCDTCARVSDAPARVRRSRRTAESEITRTGHLERIRAAVNAARLELERRFSNYLNNNTTTTRRKRRVKRKTKQKKGRKTKRGKCRPAAKNSKTRVDVSVVESVRKALGINDAVYNERPVPLSLFGNYNEFDPLDDDEGEEEEAGSFSSVGGVVVGSRVMPRHQAVERINLARRRRQKLGVSIPEPCDTGTVDLISGILQGQDSLFSGKVSQCAPDKSEAGTRSSLRVRSAAGVNASVEPSQHESNNVSNGDAAVTDNNTDVCKTFWK